MSNDPLPIAWIHRGDTGKEELEEGVQIHNAERVLGAREDNVTCTHYYWDSQGWCPIIPPAVGSE